MSCEQRPNFVHYDSYSKEGYDQNGRSESGTKILRQMHMVRPQDLPKRDFGICVVPSMPARKRKGKK